MTEKRKMLLSILLAVVMTFSMIPMIGGSTANAVVHPEITLEFGTGHETLAAEFAVYLDGDGSPLRGCDAVADGSKVKFFYLPDGDNYLGEVQEFISSILRNFMEEPYQYMDNGELLHSVSYGFEGSSAVGQKSLDKYSDEDDIGKEIVDAYQIDLPDKQTFYVLWDKPINNVSLSVKPPVCGVETKMNDDETQTNPPQVTINGQNYSFNWPSVWYGLDPFEWFSGIFKGGKDYVVDSNLKANFGYYFPKNAKCSIEGGSIVSPEDIPEYHNNPSITHYIWFEIFYRVKAVHDPGTPVKEKEVKPTCTKNGSHDEVAYCKACKEEVSREKKTDKATGHSWDNGKVTKKATCTEKGVKTYTCKNDSKHKKTESIAATGHSWDNGKVTKKATCTEKGVKTYTCKNDSKHKKTESIAATGHNWDKGKVTKKATCTKKGVKTYTCKNNSKHKKTESIAAKGHKWSKWKVTKKATTKEKGEKQRKCKNCGKIQTRSIPKLKIAKTKGVLITKMIAKGKTSLKVKWTRIKKVAGYDIFMNECNFNNKVHKLRKVKKIKGSKKCKWKVNDLEENTCYKLYVRAYKFRDGKKVYVKKSKLIHAYTGNYRGSYTNVRSVKVKKKKVTLAKGEKFRIKARVTKMVKGKKLPLTHAPKLRYRSSDKKVAKVTAKGKIKAVGEGKARIYVYAHNGKSKVVKVKVE